MKIVATTSLPAVDRPNADRWNAARSRQLKKHLTKIEYGINSGRQKRDSTPFSTILLS